MIGESNTTGMSSSKTTTIIKATELLKQFPQDKVPDKPKEFGWPN